MASRATPCAAKHLGSSRVVSTPPATITTMPNGISNTATGTQQENAVRRSGAALGIVIFLIGVALIGYVFVTARDLFNEVPPTLPIASASPAPTASPAPSGAAPTGDTAAAATAIGNIAVGFVRQVGILLLMCIAGSVIASRGVELFFKACAAAPPSARRGADAAPPPAAPSAEPAETV